MPKVGFMFSFDPIQPASAHNPAMPKGAPKPTVKGGWRCTYAIKQREEKQLGGSREQIRHSPGCPVTGEPFALAIQLHPSFPASFLWNKQRLSQGSVTGVSAWPRLLLHLRVQRGKLKNEQREKATTSFYFQRATLLFLTGRQELGMSLCPVLRWNPAMIWLRLRWEIKTG